MKHLKLVYKPPEIGKLYHKVDRIFLFTGLALRIL